jgi:hypothetical protein
MSAVSTDRGPISLTRDVRSTANCQGRLSNTNLMTEGQDFHLERRAGVPRRGQGGQERRDDREHLDGVIIADLAQIQ